MGSSSQSGLRVWSKENRDQKLITNTVRRKEDKALVLSHYGQSCSCLGCGIETFEFLTVDHIEGNGGYHRRIDKSVMGGGIYRWLLKNNFPEGFRILCMNCNWSRGVHGYCPHDVKYSNGGIISQEKEKH